MVDPGQPVIEAMTMNQVLSESLGQRRFNMLLLGLFAGAVALTRLITGLIYGVSATDPITFILGILLMTVVALTASYLPALRASRVDPVIALRIE